MDVLEDVAARFAPAAPSSVAVAAPLVVPADRLRLEQALRNIVDNALRHGDGRDP